ncbi:MAG: DEAD/DEAH box helicase family protein [Tissierellaceae bacterium]
MGVFCIIPLTREGSGKTLLALAIIERLQSQNENLVVEIIVPTIVLQGQWYNEILKRSNLPETMIGRLGGSYDDEINENKMILISVLKSASYKLADKISEDIGKDLLLVVDECHKAGAKAIGMDKAREVAAGIAGIKGIEGGRFYINEFKNIFAPIQTEFGNDYLYLGKIGLDKWFPKP